METVDPKVGSPQFWHLMPEERDKIRARAQVAENERIKAKRIAEEKRKAYEMSLIGRLDHLINWRFRGWLSGVIAPEGWW